MKTYCVLFCVRKFEDTNRVNRNRKLFWRGRGCAKDNFLVYIQHTMICVLEFLILFRFYPLHTYKKKNVNFSVVLFQNIRFRPIYIHDDVIEWTTQA